MLPMKQFLLKVLKILKNKYNVFEIKAEYENEGSRQTELMRLKDIAGKVNLPIILLYKKLNFY